MNLEELVQEFEQYDTNRLSQYYSLISTKHDNKIFQPYIPHIGKDYSKYKILMYGMAQRIEEPWEELIRMSRTAKVRQMYDARDYKDIQIAPYKVMLSVAGLYLHIKCGLYLDKLDDIHNCISATNYYKFSLSKAGKDINPNTGLKKVKNPDIYWKTNDMLSRLELEAINPSVIISFKGRHNNVLRKAKYNCIIVNDPAWILRGGGNALNGKVTWYRKIDDSKVHRLVDSYLEQIDGRYSGRKEAIKIYLIKYYSDWLKTK
jgi:hypothetical protein